MATPIGSTSNLRIDIDNSLAMVTATSTVVLAICPTGFAGYLDLQNAVAIVTTAISGMDSNETIELKYTPSGNPAVVIASLAVGTTLSATAAVGTLTPWTVAAGYEMGINFVEGDSFSYTYTNAVTTNNLGNISIVLPVNLRRN